MRGKTVPEVCLKPLKDLKNNKIDCIVMDSLPAEEMVKANDDLDDSGWRAVHRQIRNCRPEREHGAARSDQCGVGAVDE